MKKFISPILHAIFLIPLLAIVMASIELMAQKVDLLPDYIRVFELPYIFLTICIIIISGIPFFWLANKLVQSLEKLQNPGIHAHFRQSIFFYLIIIYSLTNWIVSGFRASIDDLYFLCLSSYSLIAILLNYSFLIQKLPQNE